MKMVILDPTLLLALLSTLASLGLFVLHPLLVLSKLCYKKKRRQHIEYHPYIFVTSFVSLSMWMLYMIAHFILHNGVLPTTDLHYNCFLIYCILGAPVLYVASRFYDESLFNIPEFSLDSGSGHMHISMFCVFWGLPLVMIICNTIADYLGLVCVVCGIAMHASPMSLIVSSYHRGDVADHLPLWLCVNLFLHSFAWLAMDFTTPGINLYFTITNWIGMLISLCQVGAIYQLRKRYAHRPTKMESDLQQPSAKVESEHPQTKMASADQQPSAAKAGYEYPQTKMESADQQPSAAKAGSEHPQTKMASADQQPSAKAGSEYPQTKMESADQQQPSVRGEYVSPIAKSWVDLNAKELVQGEMAEEVERTSTMEQLHRTWSLQEVERTMEQLHKTLSLHEVEHKTAMEQLHRTLSLHEVEHTSAMEQLHRTLSLHGVELRSALDQLHRTQSLQEGHSSVEATAPGESDSYYAPVEGQSSVEATTPGESDSYYTQAERQSSVEATAPGESDSYCARVEGNSSVKATTPGQSYSYCARVECYGSSHHYYYF